MTLTTKYILMKKCLNCFKISELSVQVCTQCNALFLVEASEEEKNKANEKLIELQEKRNLSH